MSRDNFARVRTSLRLSLFRQCIRVSSDENRRKRLSLSVTEGQLAVDARGSEAAREVGEP